MAKRKVSFNYLFLKHEGLELSIENALSTIVTFLLSKEKIDRKQDVNSDKFAFLDNVDYDTTSEYHTMQLLFKSAKHSYRAPLLDKNTAEARDNPKTMSEGDENSFTYKIQGRRCCFVFRNGQQFTHLWKYRKLFELCSFIIQLPI